MTGGQGKLLPSLLSSSYCQMVKNLLVIQDNWVQSLHQKDPLVPGARERHSTRDKGHEEGGSAYAKAGSSLGSPPGYSRASTPKKPESAYFIALCSHL